MTDQSNDGDRAEAGFDNQIRRLLGDAGSDAPTAPRVESFGSNGNVSPTGFERRRRRWATAGAVGLAGAAAGVAFFIVRSEPTDTIRPADPPPVTSTSPTTQPPVSTAVTADTSSTASTQPSASSAPTSTPTTTTVPSDSTATPTPLLLFNLADGYDLDYAVTAPGGQIKLVRYRDGQSDSPAIELILRGTPDDFQNPVLELSRETWSANGRTIYDDNQLAGCLPD